MKNFAAVRTAYYKDQALTKDVKKSIWITEKQKDGSSQRVKKTTVTQKHYKSAIAEIDHITRAGKTKSANVFDQFTQHNSTVFLKGSNGLLDAYHKLKDRYQKTTGKKCRSDMNTLLEQIIILSDENVRELEKKLGFTQAHLEINKCIKNYCKAFSEEFGFAQIGFSTHLDEGHFVTDENGKKQFKRNYHCHALFFNYDFKNKRSNLKHMSKKGKDPLTGKTNELNPHFQRIQTLLSEKFIELGFIRGVSKKITKRKHLEKDKFIQKKQHEAEIKLQKLKVEFHDHIERVLRYISEWLKALFSATGDASVYADLTAESVLGIDSEEVRNQLIQHIYDTEAKVEKNNPRQLNSSSSIVERIKKGKLYGHNN
ncbi:hypothetical protein EXT47_05190 [Pseudoalteromonas sp. CO342X]|uniref:hypothetical protein n=1 Tax=Pseudoalteromonas sp. CO342X TaxID=1777270 RepID=UPI0010236266|nr:hypothetical protein [Pseudoalteromonas sp. CO342X]RZG16723.1 hypothetical protein EXT47_05190 [Pseudoalteromonas sp. CO342X]